MGSENISIQVLSAILKKNGHQTTLAYDQALFDDKNYLFMPKIARFFDHKKTVIDQVLRSKPDLIAISVLTSTYQWALNITRRIKEIIDVPVVFGGIHPTTMPELVIDNDCVDMICIGEGDYALLDLCNSIENGKIEYSIPNIWFKKNGKIIKNKQRKPVEDLDILPFPDKELFIPHVKLSNCYLAVTTRGCPFTCSYCECSYQAHELKKLGVRRLRERSPDSVIKELKIMKDKINYKWVDFRNNTFTSTPSWVKEFLVKYKEEIAKPFRIFGHPATIDITIARMLKDAGCFSVQLGIESISPKVRREIMNRHETNEQILKAVSAMDSIDLPYSCDYILGVPTQNEKELKEAAMFFINRKSCYRISSFMLAYQPKVEINNVGLKYGDISVEELENMENGKHNHYLASGSIGKNPAKFRMFNAYRLFFRLIPFLPRKLNLFFLKNDIFKIFKYLPVGSLLRVIDICMIFRRHDIDAATYAKNYWYLIMSRFNKSHPAYWKLENK